MTTAEKLEKLREQMSMESIAAYIVATDDFMALNMLGIILKKGSFYQVLRAQQVLW